MEIQAEEITIGDLLVVKPGEHIPVDGILKEGHASVDESMLTGESMPVSKQQGDALIQGTIALDARIVMECNAVEEDTTLAKIIRMVEEAQGKKAPIARIADKISLYFVPTVMAIAFVAVLLWYLSTLGFAFALRSLSVCWLSPARVRLVWQHRPHHGGNRKGGDSSVSL